MHLGPWEVLAFGTLYVGAMLLAADVGLRMSPNVRSRFPGVAKFQETGLWGFTPFVLLTISGVIFLADALGALPATDAHFSISWPFWAPIALLLAIVLVWRLRRSPPPGGGILQHDILAGDDPRWETVSEWIQTTARLEASQKINPERINQLDRTVFLLTLTTVDWLYLAQVRQSLADMPRIEQFPVDTNEKLTAETEKIDKWLIQTRSRVMNSRWGYEFEAVFRRAEYEADSDLLKMQVPDGLNPMRYRLFHIACMRRDRIEAYLQMAISECAEAQRQMADMLRERPDLHNPSKRP